MWKALLWNLSPERVQKRDSCFIRLAAAVLDDSFDFSAAHLGAGQSAEVESQSLYSSSLLAQWSPNEAKKLPDAPPPSPPPAVCVDDPGCPAWAKAGECAKNPTFMMQSCKNACGICR
mmetsp:Transcript_45891/g.135623  ORF Transcript_45891/g.135623 Transcript_45891/m.135623 type:complete len:118 (+) Transcript_45891:76-429(+)